MKMHFLYVIKNKIPAYCNVVNSPIPLLSIFKG